MDRARPRVSSAWSLTLAALLLLLGCGRGCGSRPAPGPGTGSASPGAAAPGPSKQPEKVAQTPGPPVESSAGAAERGRLAERARALATVSHSIVDQTPRDHEDAAVVVRHTGSEPEAILRWVRDNTRHLAYRGLLRGAPGVLMDRSGNSLDRALFTADLLKRAGHVVRLGRTTLSKQAASGLRTALAARTQGPDPLPPLDPAEAARTFAGVPAAPGKLDQAIVATVRRDAAFGSTVQELLSRVLPALSASLGALEKRDADLVAEAEDALTDHFWVQRQAGGNWEDLDPDADTVGRLAATSTLDPDQLPDDLKHRVTFRILFESRQAGTVSEKPVFERSWAAAELVGKSFVLRHRLLPAPPLDSILASSDPAAAYVQALKAAWVVEPVLTVGSEELTDRLYTLGAEVLPANQATKSQLGFAGSAVAAVGSKMAGGFTQPFGGPAPTGAPKAPDESVGPSRITAEWLEIEVRVPGRPVEQHRRAVFDLLDPSARAAGSSQALKIDDAAKEKRGLALAGETAALVTGCTPSQDWLTRLSGQRLAGALEQVASFVSVARRPAESFQLLGEQSVPFPLWSWALTRSRNAALSPAPPIAPNIALLWSTPARPRGAGWTASIAFDIVTNRTGADFSFSHRVAQGVLDTAAEHALFPGSGDRSNTAAQHALDLASGRQWVRLAAGDTAAVNQLEVSSEAKARIREDLKRGYLVIARPRTSEEARSASWWRVDPVTGTTLGIGEHGLGGEMGEEGILNTVQRLGVCAFLLLASVAVEAHEGITAGGAAAAGIGAAFCGTGAVLHHSASFITGSAIELVVEMLATMKEPGGE